MNDLGRDALVKAALDGVPQAFGSYGDGVRRCALAVLAYAVGVKAIGSCVSESKLKGVLREFDLRAPSQRCQECNQVCHDEAGLIAHLNDDHLFDFLTIARKLADPAADHFDRLERAAMDPIEPGGVV